MYWSWPGAIVTSIHGFVGKVPIAYLYRIREVAGFRAAIPYVFYLGMYKDQRMTFGQTGTDAGEFFNVWDECTVDSLQLQA